MKSTNMAFARNIRVLALCATVGLAMQLTLFGQTDLSDTDSTPSDSDTSTSSTGTNNPVSTTSSSDPTDSSSDTTSAPSGSIGDQGQVPDAAQFQAGLQNIINGGIQSGEPIGQVQGQISNYIFGIMSQADAGKATPNLNASALTQSASTQTPSGNLGAIVGVPSVNATGLDQNTPSTVYSGAEVKATPQPGPAPSVSPEPSPQAYSGPVLPNFPSNTPPMSFPSLGPSWQLKSPAESTGPVLSPGVAKPITDPSQLPPDPIGYMDQFQGRVLYAGKEAIKLGVSEVECANYVLTGGVGGNLEGCKEAADKLNDIMLEMGK